MKKTINYFILAVSTVAMLTFIGSCSKSDNKLPAINGYNSSDDIEPSSLVAHWSFEGNFNESVQNLAPTPSSTAPTFVAGVKGQAYKGGGDTYVSYPNIGTLGSLTSLTLSVWYLQNAQPTPGTGTYVAGNGAQGMVQIYNSTGDFYVLEFAEEPRTGDSLQFDAGFKSNTTGAYGPQEGVVPTVFNTNSLGKWTHLCMTYDGTTSTYTAYQNGTVLGVGSAWSNVGTAGSVQILDGPGDSGTSLPLGNLVLSDPRGLIIGAFPQRLNLTNYNLSSATDWAGNWQGALDEIRIYNTALTGLEVGSLYQLEGAGR